MIHRPQRQPPALSKLLQRTAQKGVFMQRDMFDHLTVAALHQCVQAYLPSPSCTPHRTSAAAMGERQARATSRTARMKKMHHMTFTPEEMLLCCCMSVCAAIVAAGARAQGGQQASQKRLRGCLSDIQRNYLGIMQWFYCGTVLHALWAAHRKTRPQKAFGNRGSTGPISRAAPVVAVCDAGASRKATGALEGRAVAAGARCA